MGSNTYKVDLGELNTYLNELQALRDGFPEKEYKAPEKEKYKGEYNSWTYSYCREVEASQKLLKELLEKTCTYLESVKTTIEERDKQDAASIQQDS